MAETLLNVKFVKEVQKYPCLYNVDIAAYSRKDITEDAWLQIGKVMNMPAAACKDKWRNLRVVLIRHLKQSALSDRKRKPYYLFDEMQFLIPYLKLNFMLPTIGATNTLAEYEVQSNERIDGKEESYRDINQFVNEELAKSVIKCEQEESNSDTYNESEQINESPFRKRSREESEKTAFYSSGKFARTEQSSNESVASHSIYSNDPVVSFLNCILPELHEMDYKQFKIFKRRVLAVIDEIKPDD